MAKVGSGIIVFFCGLAGIILAYIEKVEYDRGVLATALDNMGITIVEAMTLTIVVWLLFGCVIGAIQGLR